MEQIEKDIVEDFETEDLIAEIKERGELTEAVEYMEREQLIEITEDIEAEELICGREADFYKLFAEGFGDLNTPPEKETFKKFLCDLLGVSYHTPFLTNLTVLKEKLK